MSKGNGSSMRMKDDRKKSNLEGVITPKVKGVATKSMNPDTPPEIIFYLSPARRLIAFLTRRVVSSKVVANSNGICISSIQTHNVTLTGQSRIH